MTLKLDDGFAGNINLQSLLESDNRLYIQPKPSMSNLTIRVKAKPIDSDGDGVYDNEDNCPLVPNSGQQDSNHITGTIVDFTKTDYADWNDPANQDCITANVCITRQDSQGIYNAVTESGFDATNYTSPADTEWAY